MPRYRSPIPGMSTASLVRRLLSLLLGGSRRRKRGDSLLGLLVLVILLLLAGLYKGESTESAVEPVHIGDAPQEQLAAPEELRTEARSTDARDPAAQQTFVFLMHNVENYFVDDAEGRSKYRLKMKPVAEREAVADVIASAKPAIVGLVEIGGPRALQDLRERLRRRGLEYPYFVVLTRNGEDRALGLLSQLPIVSNDSKANYGLYGQQRRKMLRGILDVTVQAKDGRRFRIFGAHLKSRVSSDPAAAASLRKREAQTLALYINAVTKRQPNMPVLVFGDWNDGPKDESIQVLMKTGGNRGLRRLSPEDSDGGTWTLYYKAGSEYRTFDQIFVNSVLQRRMGSKSRSGIVDIRNASRASDHRAVWCELR